MYFDCRVILHSVLIFVSDIFIIIGYLLFLFRLSKVWLNDSIKFSPLLYVYDNKFSVKSNELESSVTSVWTAVQIKIHQIPLSVYVLRQKLGLPHPFVYAQLFGNVPYKEFHEQLCID